MNLKKKRSFVIDWIRDEHLLNCDACQDRLRNCGKHREVYNKVISLNIQDVRQTLFGGLVIHLSRWEKQLTSYYTDSTKLLDKICHDVKQQHKLDEVSYHKLFDILKQYQKEVNELRAKRMAKNANPLALVATAQTLQDSYYQTSKSHKSYAPTSKASLPSRSHETTRHKGKEIAKPITPLSESASEEDSDPKQAQKDKDINKNVDATSRYKNDNQTGQFRNQRAVNVAGAIDTVGGQVVQQSRI
ncbi:hypothetical protein Tco_0877358 [Tanacetum coccineum]|uniref:Uncharacterized protein n=1 Tax=Tanacetum coccineum TaxID=301880 RepID=A0ABQ5BXG0_9ASTR